MGMPFAADPVTLSEEEKTELEQMTQSRTLPAGDVMRARMVLLLAGGTSYQEIQKLLDTTAPTISRWIMSRELAMCLPMGFLPGQ